MRNLPKNQRRMVMGRLSAADRDVVVSRFQPSQQLIYSFGIMHAYMVPPQYRYERARIPVVFTGVHRGQHSDLVLCRLGFPRRDGRGNVVLEGNRPVLEWRDTRPDGKLYHLTLSTAYDWKPAQAYQAMRTDEVEWLRDAAATPGPHEADLYVNLIMSPVQVLTPTWNPRHAAAAA